MPLSDSQLNANRENAQKSTGPRTDAGKARSRLNAFRHGITAKILVMTAEETLAYKGFSRDLFKEWCPQGPTETLFVQTMVDTHWRLNNMRSHELCTYAIHHGESDEMLSDHPEVDAALAASEVLSSKTDELKLISSYEQRRTRTLEPALTQLQP